MNQNLEVLFMEFMTVLWLAVGLVSAITIGNLLSTLLGTMIITTPWYRKWFTKFAIDYSKEVIEEYEKLEEDTKEKEETEET